MTQSNASYVLLNVEQLIKSQSNVREKHTKEDIFSMGMSIRQRGIINAPCVAKDGADKYEIIAGMLRVLGAKSAELTEIQCKDVSKLSEADRIEVSLSENIDRVRMTSIQLYQAFHKLFKAGLSVHDIAIHFNESDRKIGQLLAIGGLPKKILHMAELGQMGDRGLEALACASKKDVARYLKLPKDKRPRDWQIQEWLQGSEGWFRADAAMFDLELYKGGIVNDLFARDEDERWLTDGGQFWDLQDEWIATKKEALKKKGWTIELIEHWQPWAYEKKAKAKGGYVVCTVDRRTGAVGFHVGVKRLGKAGKETPAKDATPAEKPDTSKAFDDYLSEIRHLEVQDCIITNKRGGLVVAILLILKSYDNWNIQNGRFAHIKSEKYMDSLEQSDNYLRIAKAADELYKKLGISNSLFAVEPVIVKLNKMTLAELAGIIGTLVATKWHVQYDEQPSRTIAKKVLGLTQCDNWYADDAFWNGITSKKTLQFIASDNNITMPASATAKAMRGILKDKVPKDWIPRWLTF